jgi:adenosylmethionine-8-amino-7-oxononanoate aminotransferase
VGCFCMSRDILHPKRMARAMQLPDYAHKYFSGHELGLNKRLVDEAFSRGLILYPGSSGGMINGKGGNAIMVAPPFIITKDQLAELLSILDGTITTIEKQVMA